MSIKASILGLFRRPTPPLPMPAEKRSPEMAALPVELDPETFIYLMFPENLPPLDRGDKYEEPLSERLAAARLGEVTGGGSQLSDLRPDGSRTIEFCGVDIDVYDRSGALELLRKVVPKLGAPDGTQIHYTVNGVALQDELRDGSWDRERPRTLLHPGFGV